jgi:phage repressor protein C with HTH and peptisase S24 domain
MYTERVDRVNMIYVNTECDIALMRQDMGERLRSARISAGFNSARSAAIKFGWTPSTYAAHENGQNEFDPERASIYAKAFKVSPGWLLTGEGEKASKASAPAPTTGSTVEELPAGKSFRFAKIDGQVQAGAFLAVEVFDDDLGEVISAPRDPQFPFARQIAYQVKGDSMDQAKPKPMDDGDYIICAAWEDLGMEPRDGLNVVVQQTTADGQLRERSVKELRVFPDRVEFHPRSSNKAHKPIVMKRDHHTDDGKEVAILSLVRFVFNNQALPV